MVITNKTSSSIQNEFSRFGMKPSEQLLFKEANNMPRISLLKLLATTQVPKEKEKKSISKEDQSNIIDFTDTQKFNLRVSLPLFLIFLFYYFLIFILKQSNYIQNIF